MKYYKTPARGIPAWLVFQGSLKGCSLHLPSPQDAPVTTLSAYRPCFLSAVPLTPVLHENSPKVLSDFFAKFRSLLLNVLNFTLNERKIFPCGESRWALQVPYVL